VIRGVATTNEEGGLTALTIVDAALGLAIGFGLFWIYFDFVARRPTRPDFVVALVWVYLHIAMLIGIVLVGVAVSEVLLVEGQHAASALRLLFAALGFTLVMIGLLEFTLDRAEDEPTAPRLSPALKGAVGLFLCGIAAAGLELPTTLALAIGVAALAVPAAYGARVYYRAR
jgi:low temperature requirement protein LtrA